MGNLNPIPEMILAITAERAWNSSQIASIVTRVIPLTARSQVHSALANLCRRGDVLKGSDGLYRAAPTPQLPHGNTQAERR